jgi:hypothetical protein
MASSTYRFRHLLLLLTLAIESCKKMEAIFNKYQKTNLSSVRALLKFLRICALLKFLRVRTSLKILRVRALLKILRVCALLKILHARPLLKILRVCVCCPKPLRNAHSCLAKSGALDLDKFQRNPAQKMCKILLGFVLHNKIL